MQPYLLSLAASLLAAPLAVQAQMEMLSDDDLSAIHGEGIYTLTAGTVSLYSVDMADIGSYTVGAVPLASIYNGIYDRKPLVVEAAKTQALTAANAALIPVNVGLRAQFATIPVFGPYFSHRYTPVLINYSADPTGPGSVGM